MRVKMVIGYHLVWTAYGWWLPNDPRGSGSQTIVSDVIAELGAIHRGRRKVLPCSTTIREFYRRAEAALVHELLTFAAPEFEVIAASLSACVSKRKYTCYGCAVMPDHVHMLIRRHRDDAEEMLRVFQDSSRMGLRQAGLRPIDHPTWGGAGWKVYLDDEHDIRRTIRYIQDNPPKRKLPKQRWSFVTPYDGWPTYGRSRR